MTYDKKFWISFAIAYLFCTGAIAFGMGAFSAATLAIAFIPGFFLATILMALSNPAEATRELETYLDRRVKTTTPRFGRKMIYTTREVHALTRNIAL